MAENKSTPPGSGGRLRKLLVVGAILAGLAAGGGVTEGIDAAAGPTSNPIVTTGQVVCPSYGKQAIGVTDVQFQMSNGQQISAALAPITDSTGKATNWDHYSAYIPESAAGAYVVRVTCGDQENWTSRVTGTASRTLVCGVVDGECTASLPGASISRAHPPYQKGVPEPLHTPES